MRSSLRFGLNNINYLINRLSFEYWILNNDYCQTVDLFDCQIAKIRMYNDVCAIFLSKLLRMSFFCCIFAAWRTMIIISRIHGRTSSCFAWCAACGWRNRRWSKPIDEWCLMWLDVTGRFDEYIGDSIPDWMKQPIQKQLNTVRAEL